MTLEELVSQLHKVYGAHLRTVVLYGSAAAGEHIPKRSDYNVLVIVDELTMEHMRAEAAVARAWGEAGNPPPLTLTLAEWRGSADIFPMEYADILERHQVLHGSLPEAARKIDAEHLRLQLEQQVMGKLIQLRQGVLQASGKKGALLALLEASLSTFMVLFRATARLHGEEPPESSESLCERVAALTGVDTSPFVRVVRHARGAAPLGADEAPALLDRYLAETGKLKAHLDQFAPTT